MFQLKLARQKHRQIGLNFFYFIPVEPYVKALTEYADAPLGAPLAQIACTVEAYPRPTIIWQLNGVKLLDSNKYFLVWKC